MSTTRYEHHIGGAPVAPATGGPRGRPSTIPGGET